MTLALRHLATLSKLPLDWIADPRFACLACSNAPATKVAGVVAAPPASQLARVLQRAMPTKDAA